MKPVRSDGVRAMIWRLVRWAIAIVVIGVIVFLAYRGFQVPLGRR